ncbi:MAG: hypothetical protein JW806_07260 [Sedimentisphaerales bacterium]|nr:hypothetical protein [Sedimentisphaerales bacterium]
MDKAKRKKQYGKLDWELRIVFLFFTFFIGGLYTFVLYGISLFIHSIGNYEYVIVPSIYFWFIFSLFLGIISSVVPVEVVFKYSLGDRRYKELWVYSAKQDGISRKASDKLFRILVPLVIIVSIIVFSFLFNCYVKISDKQITVNQLTKFSKNIYDFNDIAELKQFESVIRKGRIYNKRCYKITFNDGNKVSFEESQFNKNLEELSAILHFISDRSNIEIKIKDPASEKR